MFDLAVIVGLGVLFPVVHAANAWLFSFTEVNSHIAFVYLPAFLRLLNVLVLGKFKGTLAGLLGGAILLLASEAEPLPLKVLNMLCSSAGPLIAVLLFEHFKRRAVKLTSLRDLAVVTVVYCVANALVHHLAWSVFAPQLVTTWQAVLTMIVGDLVGALIGAYLLKWVAGQLALRQAS